MRVLLIGGSGTYGALLRTALGRRAEVVVSQRRLGPHFENYFDALHPLINPGWLTEFDTVVYAVGLPSIQSSEDAPEDSQRLNHLTPVLLNELCKSRQIQFIFLSTGAVLPFMGLSPAHAERLWLDRGIGATRYGLDKALAEHEILENQGTVVRLSKIALPIWRPLNSWVENLRSGQEVTAFCDHYVSPIDAESASLALWHCISKNFAGLIQISAKDQLNYFQLASLIAKRLGFTNARIRATRASEVLGRQFTFSDTVLDNRSYSALTGNEPLSSREVMEAWCDVLLRR